MIVLASGSKDPIKELSEEINILLISNHDPLPQNKPESRRSSNQT